MVNGLDWDRDWKTENVERDARTQQLQTEIDITRCVGGTP